MNFSDIPETHEEYLLNPHNKKRKSNRTVNHQTKTTSPAYTTFPSFNETTLSATPSSLTNTRPKTGYEQIKYYIDFLDPDGNDLSVNCTAISKEELKSKIRKNLLEDYFDIIRFRHRDNWVQVKKYYGINFQDNHVAASLKVWKKDKPNYKTLNISTSKETFGISIGDRAPSGMATTSCYACQNGYLSQEGHMEYGGCLYDPDNPYCY